MSEASTINTQAFQPYNGGQGVVLAVTTTSARAQIPGLEGGREDGDKRRVYVSNSTGIPIRCRLGASDVQATLASFEVLPGCGYLLTPPIFGPASIWIAAITESGTASLSACSGTGS